MRLEKSVSKMGLITLGCWTNDHLTYWFFNEFFVFIPKDSKRELSAVVVLCWRATVTVEATGRVPEQQRRADCPTKRILDCGLTSSRGRETFDSASSIREEFSSIWTGTPLLGLKPTLEAIRLFLPFEQIPNILENLSNKYWKFSNLNSPLKSEKARVWIKSSFLLIDAPEIAWPLESLTFPETRWSSHVHLVQSCNSEVSNLSFEIWPCLAIQTRIFCYNRDISFPRCMLVPLR